MKKKWNEKTKKITVAAALAAVGLIALIGISLCIYRDNPQKVEIAEAQEQEDAAGIPEDNLNVPAKESTVMLEDEKIVVSTEISKETETENIHVQSLQPAPVKTEDKKPAEASAEEKKPTGGSKENKTADAKEPAGQPQEGQPSKDTGLPQHGDIQGDKIYLDGFGWVDYNGGETVVMQAEDIYENGNKIGIMD